MGILLDYDEQADEIRAVGVTGEDLLDRFFSQFEMQLELAYGGLGKARAPVQETATVVPLSEYTSNDMSC